MSGSFTGFPIPNVAIPSLPDLGGVTDAGMLVGERSGTGRFAATAIRDYVMTTVTAGYLPLAGGTLSGNLSVKDTLFFTASSMSFNAGANYSIWTLDASNREIMYTRATGVLSYRGPTGTDLWTVDASGNSGLAGFLEANGDISTNGKLAAAVDVFARGGHYYFGSDDGRWLGTDVNGTTLMLWSDGWRLYWSRANAGLTFYSNAGVANFSVDANGNGLFHGTVHGSNVTLMETRIDELQAQVADLQAALTSLIEARQAEMATPRATD